MKHLETDYLLVGAGAFGMAFLDELINNTKDTTVVVVDKRAKPGGHWNDAYPFVRLHQPAATYGVNSRPLGQGGADLASKYQILAYYEQVMEDLLATGRLSYYPLCEYVEEGRIVSLLDSDLKYEVKVKKKTVNATCLTTDVPATRPPQYGVADGVNLVPINGLADIKEPWQRYLVIGAGKTGLDALIFLLDQNVDPDKISWVVSNDCWYINRSYLDAGNICKFVKGQFDPILRSTTVDQMYEEYENAGMFFRIDKAVNPSKMRAATVSENEMERLALIKNIIRYGRVERIEKSRIIFKCGDKIPTSSETLHIDCSASGTVFPPVKPIFAGSMINLQMVQSPQTTYSGSILASLEIAFPNDDDKKNQICNPIPMFQDKEDWVKFMKISVINGDKIGKTLGISWMRSKRLCPLYHVTILDFAWVMIYMFKNQDAILQKMEKLSTQLDTNH